MKQLFLSYFYSLKQKRISEQDSVPRLPPLRRPSVNSTSDESRGCSSQFIQRPVYPGHPQWASGWSCLRPGQPPAYLPLSEGNYTQAGICKTRNKTKMGRQEGLKRMEYFILKTHPMLFQYCGFCTEPNTNKTIVNVTIG